MQRLDAIMTANKMSIAIDDMEGIAHSAPHPAHAPSSLLTLPLLRLPSLLTRVNFKWHLFSGKDPMDHYIFPVPTPVRLNHALLVIRHVQVLYVIRHSSKTMHVSISRSCM